MPRDGSGTYTYPPGTRGAPATPIESLKYNNYIDDVALALNTPLPITAGGTGGATVNDTLDNLSAEKFKQVVTNWDTAVWRAGSFYASSAALGTAPITGHAFAGICYFANATDFICEATDLTDPINPVQYIRIMVAGVWGAWTRLGVGSAAANLGEYTFDSTITFPPASSQIRFNNAIQNSTTEIFISHIGALGGDNSGLIPFFLKSGSDIIIQDKDEGPKYKIFTATADPVLSSGDFRVTVTFKSGGTDLDTTQRMLVGITGGSSVLYNTPQALSLPQQEQARKNIYAAPFDAMAYSGMQVNGGMELSQENGNTAVTAISGTAKYVVDGWYVYYSSASAAMTAGQFFYSTLPWFPGCLYFRIGTGNTFSAAGDLATIQTPIEGSRVARMAYGTPNAAPVTIAFWINSSVTTGKFTVALQNGAANRSYVAEVTVNAANAWEYKTVTIPGDTIGSWDTINGVGLYVEFGFASGFNYRTTPNVWTSGNFRSTSAAVNFFSTTGSQVVLTGVVVLPGNEAPTSTRSPFIVRPSDDERFLCCRYWQKSHAWNVLPGTALPGGAATGGEMQWAAGGNYVITRAFPFRMRATPAMTAYDNIGASGKCTYFNGAWVNGGAVSLSTASDAAAIWSFTIAGSTFASFDWVANARL